MLLDSLPEDVLERLAAGLEPIGLASGQVLQQPAQAIRHAYFPTTSIVSKLYVMEKGTSAEIALIGREGMVGMALFLGGQTLLSEARVQRGGNAIRLDASILRDEFDRRGAMMQVLLRHTQALIVQMMETASCNRHGTLEQRFCRWLLMTLDRSPDHELEMTHEAIANLLGVRREGVTELAGRLQQLGAIRYRRGHITVLDRAALEERAFESYTPLQSGRGPVLSG
jgi:CRP-like cAMP-binding protein